MKRIVSSNITPDDFGSVLDYLSDEFGEREHPALVAAARELDLACLDTKASLPVVYAAFQFGYVLAQVDAAAEWRNSHRKKDSKAFEEKKRKAVEMVIGMKEARPKRTYEDIEAEVAKGFNRDPRTIRRWRKSLVTVKESPGTVRRRRQRGDRGPNLWPVSRLPTRHGPGRHEE